jgi:UDP-N-acetyl-D-mannosaminuronic acid transferase (WecB/TagA/CpsF family)
MSVELHREPEARLAPLAAAWPPKLDLLGLAVSATHYDEAVAAVASAAASGQGAVVSCHAVHAVVTFSGDPELRAKANAFEMITPSPYAGPSTCFTARGSASACMAPS